MKRLMLTLLTLSIFATIEAQSGTKTCPSCGGSGHPFGHSELTCGRCNGSGRIAQSASEMQREARDNARYADNANDLMEQFNLSPEEFFAYEELIKEAMQQVPVYQTCTACNGTGDCQMCGGYMNVSLDDDLCRVCGGSGQCLGCKGLGKLQVGYQDNPNKEQLIQRANELLHSHEASPSGSTSSAGNATLNNAGSEFFSNEQTPAESGSSQGAFILFFLGVCSAALLGILGFLAFKFLKK